MIVIADASPLNYLVLIRESELLREMYGPVVVPEGAVRELNSDATPSAEGSGASSSCSKDLSLARKRPEHP